MSASREPGAPVAAGVIPLSVPHVAGNEWQYVRDCLDSGWVSSVGAYVDRFEELVSERFGGHHAVATISGTAALHVALLLAGVEPGDEVVTSTLTFIAPANAVRYAGAHPVFVDAEPRYWQLDVDKLGDFLRDECESRDGGLVNRRTGRRVRALLPVHVLGHPFDAGPLVELAREHGLVVVEDAAEALGALYRDGEDWRSPGELGDLACLSFNGNKVITSGGGGMIVTRDAALAERARYLTTQAKDDPVAYVHGEVGFNYRPSNVLAAIGCAQLEQLDAFVERKRELAASYAAAFAGVPGLQPMPEAAWARSTFWMYTVLVDAAVFPLDSSALIAQLDREAIQARPLWEPMHRSAAHAGAQAYRCKTADVLAAQGVSLPCSVGLSDADQRRVIEAVLRAAG